MATYFWEKAVRVFPTGSSQLLARIMNKLIKIGLILFFISFLFYFPQYFLQNEYEINSKTLQYIFTGGLSIWLIFIGCALIFLGLIDTRKLSLLGTIFTLVLGIITSGVLTVSIIITIIIYHTDIVDVVTYRNLKIPNEKIIFQYRYNIDPDKDLTWRIIFTENKDAKFRKIKIIDNEDLSLLTKDKTETMVRDFPDEINVNDLKYKKE